MIYIILLGDLGESGTELVTTTLEYKGIGNSQEGACLHYEVSNTYSLFNILSIYSKRYFLPSYM